MAEDCWFNFPLLVHIQSVNSKALTNQFSKDRPKNVEVTCVEGSNRFIFVGHSSGTVDVYFRTKLDYLFTISVQTGKITSILCSENENYVVVGSVHGKIAVFRCFHQMLRNDGNNKSKIVHDKNEASLFKLLYQVTHHIGNEVTALYWSSNERNLFIGDSCGLVSQLNVESLEQFPRPLPTKSVLEASSRVMQMDYMFPYLAIATVYSVFLCDIESSEFVRIQLKKHCDIRSTGLCFLLSFNQHPDNPEVKVPILKLLISETASGLVHSANMEGVIVESTKISTFANTTMCSAKLFSPTLENNADLMINHSVDFLNEDRSNISLGNLLVTDTNHIISYSRDELYIIEPSQRQVISWIVNFNKIQKVKLVSNYLFIWYGKTLGLISLTQFRLYGEQLWKAGLAKVLERWIDHAIFSIGWRALDNDADDDKIIDSELQDVQFSAVEPSKNDESSNQIACMIFKSMFGQFGALGNESTEDVEFSTFVYSHLPIGLVKIPPAILISKPPLEQTKYVQFITTELVPLLEKFTCSEHQADVQVQIDTNIEHLINCVSIFYSEQNINSGLNESKNKSGAFTFLKALQNASQFLSSATQLVEETKTTLRSVKRCKSLMNDFLQLNIFNTKPIMPNSQYSNFYKYAQKPTILNWFAKLGMTEEDILQDAIRADLLIYLTPFFIHSILVSSMNSLKFFSWIISFAYLNVQQNCPYTALVRSAIFGERSFKMDSSKFSSQLMAFIYRDCLQSDILNMSAILHHLITLAYFVSDESENGSDARNAFRMLVKSLPTQHWSRTETNNKIRQLCSNNIILLRMLIESCLADDDSNVLCDCGVPIEYDRLFPRNHNVPCAQNILDESIFQLILEQVHDSHVPFEKSNAFQFAMKRSLTKVLLNKVPVPVSSLVKILLRSGSCDLLQSITFTSNLAYLVLENQTKMPEQCCNDCGCTLSNISDYRRLSYDCIGIWMLNNNTLDQSIQFLRSSSLNKPGQLSRRFYQNVVVIARRKLIKSGLPTCAVCR